jgi:hypothetical protein
VTRRKIFSRPQKKNFIFSLVQKQQQHQIPPNQTAQRQRVSFCGSPASYFLLRGDRKSFFCCEAERERKREISNTTLFAVTRTLQPTAAK